VSFTDSGPTSAKTLTSPLGGSGVFTLIGPGGNGSVGAIAQGNGGGGGGGWDSWTFTLAPGGSVTYCIAAGDPNYGNDAVADTTPNFNAAAAGYGGQTGLSPIAGRTGGLGGIDYSGAGHSGGYGGTGNSTSTGGGGSGGGPGTPSGTGLLGHNAVTVTGGAEVTGGSGAGGNNGAAGNNGGNSGALPGEGGGGAGASGTPGGLGAKGLVTLVWTEA
jgi:hypothetical protein